MHSDDDNDTKMMVKVLYFSAVSSILFYFSFRVLLALCVVHVNAKYGYLFLILCTQAKLWNEMKEDEKWIECRKYFQQRVRFEMALQLKYICVVRSKCTSFIVAFFAFEIHKFYVLCVWIRASSYQQFGWECVFFFILIDEIMEIGILIYCTLQLYFDMSRY